MNATEKRKDFEMVKEKDFEREIMNYSAKEMASCLVIAMD